MSMIFIGPSGSCEFPWIQYALLRDNVAHYFGQKGKVEAFSELQRAGEALGGRAVTASALRLREEVSRAQALCLLTVDKLAISDRTKDVLFLHPMSAQPPSQPTQIVGSDLQRPWCGGEPRSLGDVFGNLIESLLAITQGAQDRDIVEVIDS